MDKVAMVVFTLIMNAVCTGVLLLAAGGLVTVALSNPLSVGVVVVGALAIGLAFAAVAVATAAAENIIEVITE